MKKTMWSAVPLVMLALVLFLPHVHAQSMGPRATGGDPAYGPYESGGDWNYCPYCGSPYGPRRGYGMGPGGMHRRWDRGPWAVGPDYGYGPDRHHRGMGPGYGYGPPSRVPEEPLGRDDAKARVEEYIGSGRNPNLKVGEIEDKGPVFQVQIVTKEGSLVDELAVHKRMGWVQSIY